MQLSSWQKSVVSLTRRLPVNGLGRRAALWLRKPVLLSFKGAEVDTEVLGLKLCLQPADNISERRILFMPQFFDPAERAAMAQLAATKSNFTFVDVGANAGLYSLIAAKLSPLAKVLAVEPQPEMVRRFTRNIALNNFSNIIVAPVAVSDSEGEVTLVLSATNRGEATLRDVGGERVTVPGRTLHALLGEHHFSSIDIMKIDVEGMEDKILAAFFASAPETLWPRMMFLEKSPQRWEDDCMALCQRHGYRDIGGSKMNAILVRG